MVMTTLELSMVIFGLMQNSKCDMHVSVSSTHVFGTLHAAFRVSPRCH